MLTDTTARNAGITSQADSAVQLGRQSAVDYKEDKAQPSSALSGQILQPELNATLLSGPTSSSAFQLNQETVTATADPEALHSNRQQHTTRAKQQQRPTPESLQMQPAMAQGGWSATLLPYS